MEMQMPSFLKRKKEEKKENGEKAAKKGTEKGKGGRGSSSSGGDKQHLEKLVVALARLGLESAVEVRELQAVNLVTLLCPENWEAVEASLKAGKEFQELRAQKQGEDIGSPHVMVALAFLQKAQKMEVLKQGVRDRIKEWWSKEVDGRAPEEVAAAVPVFKMRKPQKPSRVKADWGEDQTYAKLTMRLRDEELMEMLAKELTAAGAVMKGGIAPRKGTEREVLQLLKAVQKE